jgi:hypothetical protein
MVLLPDAPGYEYYRIGLFFGNFFTVMRMSMGDTSILGALEYSHDDKQTNA